jgi:hypothetical protein
MLFMDFIIEVDNVSITKLEKSFKKKGPVNYARRRDTLTIIPKFKNISESKASMSMKRSFGSTKSFGSSHYSGFTKK